MYSNKTNPKERVDAEGFELTSGRSPRRTSASIPDLMLLPRVTPLGGMFPVLWAQKGSYLVKTSRKMNPTRPFAPQNESRWRQGMVWTFSRVGSFVTHTRVWPIMHGLMHAQVATRSHGFQLRYAVYDTQLR